MELAWDTGAASTGFSIQGGTNGTRGLFGLYFCTNVSAGTRLPIMYSKDTGTQSSNVLTIASGTLATTNITFSGTLNSVNSTTFGYISGLTSSAQTQLDNKGGLATTNYWTNGNNFNGQLSGGYNASGTIYGSQTEMFFTGHRSWANGGDPIAGNNVYEMSFDTGFYKRGLTIQGGESNTNTASSKSSIFGLYYRTFVGSGTDPTRTPIMYGADLETGAINNTLTIPSSLRLYGDLKLFGGDAITNTQLTYLSTLTSNVQTQITSNTTSITSNTTSITTLNTKTTDISFISGTTNKTKIVNDCETSTLSFLTSLNGISTTVFGYLSGLTSSIQTQLTNIVSSITTINSKLPVGMIIQHPKNNLASPYLLCNGLAVSRSTYSALFTSIGTLYGAGDGSTTFNLPNYQACFLRMYGNQTIGSTTYNTASVGTAVNDSIIGHQHSGQSGQFLSTSTSTTSINGYASLAVQKPTASNFGNTGGVISGGGAETAPAHHCIYYYILAL
jgi:microcystin-dependent protein